MPDFLQAGIVAVLSQPFLLQGLTTESNTAKAASYMFEWTGIATTHYAHCCDTEILDCLLVTVCMQDWMQTALSPMELRLDKEEAAGL